METASMNRCSNQYHIEDQVWPVAEWRYTTASQVDRYLCDNCRRLAILLHPSERVHLERVPATITGTQYDQDRGNRT